MILYPRCRTQWCRGVEVSRNFVLWKTRWNHPGKGSMFPLAYMSGQVDRFTSEISTLVGKKFSVIVIPSSGDYSYFQVKKVGPLQSTDLTTWWGGSWTAQRDAEHSPSGPVIHFGNWWGIPLCQIYCYLAFTYTDVQLIIRKSMTQINRWRRGSTLQKIHSTRQNKTKRAANVGEYYSETNSKNTAYQTFRFY